MRVESYSAAESDSAARITKAEHEGVWTPRRSVGARPKASVLSRFSNEGASCFAREEGGGGTKGGAAANRSRRYISEGERLNRAGARSGTKAAGAVLSLVPSSGSPKRATTVDGTSPRSSKKAATSFCVAQGVAAAGCPKGYV